MSKEPNTFICPNCGQVYHNPDEELVQGINSVIKDRCPDCGAKVRYEIKSFYQNVDITVSVSERGANAMEVVVPHMQAKMKEGESNLDLCKRIASSIIDGSFKSKIRQVPYPEGCTPKYQLIFDYEEKPNVFICSNCGQVYHNPDEELQQGINCPDCGTKVR